MSEISIHAAREGGDAHHPDPATAHALFQSTPPVKAATQCADFLRVCSGISIHAAREGGDTSDKFCFSVLSISIHAAREGGDGIDTSIASADEIFQSTPPVKAATLSAHGYLSPCRFQSTPPVKAATLRAVCLNFKMRFQSTPPVKAATDIMLLLPPRAEFQSTPPVKAATDDCIFAMDDLEISIHAAREGGDKAAGYAVTGFNRISIHAAREGGDASCPTWLYGEKEFQSTPPVKAATIVWYCYDSVNIFQSTPPVKAATVLYSSSHRAPQFQSTPPVKAATRAHFYQSSTPQFQSTPPVKAATIACGADQSASKISIHAAREGGDKRKFA